jgi:hypothetical protein
MQNVNNTHFNHPVWYLPQNTDINILPIDKGKVVPAQIMTTHGEVEV